MKYNKITLGFEALNNGDLVLAKEYFSELFKVLINSNQVTNHKFDNNSISICKGLGEINLKQGNIKEALNNYLFIYLKITKKDFDVLATIGQIYQNLGEDEKSKFFFKEAKKTNIALFKKRFGENIKNISSRVQDNNRNIYIYIISKCRFTCCFCDRGENKYKNNLKLETTLQEVKNIIISNYKEGVESISIGGNEPLTNKNILEIFGYLNSLNIELKLYTSGSEVNKLFELLKFENIKEVYLPIYSYNPDIHDKVVGKKGAFADLMLIEKVLKEKGILINYGKLLISSNISEEGYIKKGETFNILHPRDKKLYLENSVSLTDIISKIYFGDDKYYVKYKNNNLPFCLIYDKIFDKEGFFLKVKSEYNSIVEEKKSQNNYSEYYKPTKCEKCLFKNYCLGYYKIYFKKYGEKEINPI